MRLTISIFAFLFVSFILTETVKGQDLSDSIYNCFLTAGEDATYLKGFAVELEAARTGSPPPVFRQSLALRRNVQYRFTICNLDASEDEAVLRLYDQSKLILSTWYPETGKEYPNINFHCKKSGVYTIVISFKKGNEGKAIGVMSYVNK